MKKQLTAEVNFLRVYYKYYVDRNGATDGFIENVTKTLVKSDQISPEGLAEFVDILTKEKEIAIKTQSIDKLQKQIDALRKDVEKLAKTTSPASFDDGCGHTSRRTTSAC
jgi:hypothetical protein